ncbi:PadR family transcriptional regulator [Streptomyces sp. NPDC059605]|uniref:PadR family transcriptional regulator n=1 Tax=unclassified Streptomyces TaxID=2593676 RepID=UPI0033A9A6CD
MTKGLPANGDQRRSQLLRGVLDLCLLSLIAERPRYGFEFVSSLADSGLDLVSEGSIYPLLARLERDGAISSYRAPSASGGAPRKYYRLTEAGHVELASGRAVWHAFSGHVGQVLAATEPTGGSHHDESADHDERAGARGLPQQLGVPGHR